LETTNATAGRRYKVLEAVGRGGFGTVYKAALLGPGGFRKTVALKVLNPEIAEKEDLAARLRDEARMLGLLKHRAIVHVDGLQRLADRWALVMEFVEGVDLKHLLTRTGPMPVGPALEVMEEVASALHTAYASTGEGGAPLRLLHRDVKPSNVRLTPGGEVKVLDFGVARAEFKGRESQTESVFFGSLMYMAPERLDGIDGHRGDVYGCGATLYELLVGEPLGRTSGNRERHEARVSEGLEKLWAACPDEPVYRTVAACLSYDEDERPTAHTLARHLRNLRKERPGPFLRDWAEQVVPRVPPEIPGSAPDDLSGTILAEDGAALSGSLGPLPVSRPPNRLAWGLAAAAIAFVGVVGVGVAAVVAVAPSGAAEDEEFELGGGTVEVVDAAPAEDPAAVLASATPTPAPAPAARPPAPRADKPSRAAARPVAAEPDEPDELDEPDEPAAPAALAEAPAPAPAATGGAGATARVLLAGGATKLQLVGASGTFTPGAVPPGAYAVDADFGDGTWKRAGTVRVRDGELARLTCREALGRCTKR
jgi:serine/threonine protein kinase